MFLTLVSLGVVGATNFLARTLVARELGPGPIGTYALVIVTFNLASLAIGLGMPVFNSCFAKREPLGVLVSNSILWSGTSLIGLGLLCACVLAILPSGHQGDHPGFLWFAILLAPVGLLTQCNQSLLQGLGRMGLYNLVPIISVLSNGLLLAIVLYVLRLQLWGALAAWASAQGIALVAALFFVGRQRPLQFSLDRSVMGQSLRFGIQVWLGQAVGFLNFRIALFLVQLLLKRDAVGYYVVAMTMAEILYYIPTAIGTSLLSRLASSSGPEAARLTATGCRHALYLNFMIALALASSGGFLIRHLFTKAFEPSGLPLLMLLPGVFAYSLAHITTTYFNAYVGRPIINTLVAGLSTLVQFISIVIFVPSMGMAGAAMGTSVGYVVAIGVNFIIFRRVAGVKLREVFSPKISDLRLYKGYLSVLSN
jgi:O-antigen/teichoic acid export membrane protein